MSGNDVRLNRIWAMPNKNTFSIKPIKELLGRYVDKDNKLWIDPFANSAKVATITNDLNPEFDTDYHMMALDFMKIFMDSSVYGVLFDPPYAPRQIKECYNGIGLKLSFKDTQATFWSQVKDEIVRVLVPDGIVICFGWNSNGCGKKRGLKLEEILLVPHGGNHNDTIVTVERKVM